MNARASTTVTISLELEPGEAVLIKPASLVGWSLASVSVVVYDDEETGEIWSHVEPFTARGYKEAVAGGFSKSQRAQKMPFALRREMLPSNVIRHIETAYAQRVHFGTLLPSFDVTNGVSR
jgi:hypothetical protein